MCICFVVAWTLLSTWRCRGCDLTVDTCYHREWDTCLGFPMNHCRYWCLYHRLIWTSHDLPQLTDLMLSSGWMSTYSADCLTSRLYDSVQFSHWLGFSLIMMYAARNDITIWTQCTLVKAIKLTGAGLQRYREWGLGSGIVCFCLALWFDQSCSWLRLGPPTSSLTNGHRNPEINTCRWTEM